MRNTLYRLIFDHFWKARAFRRHFHSAWYERPVEPNRLSRSVLLVGNHVSWWDGFLVREWIRNELSGRTPFALVTEEQVRSHPMLEAVGSYPIDRTSPRSLLKALHFFRNARARDSAFALLIFPQGRIVPSFKNPLDFERGIELFSKALAPIDLVPFALHIEPLQHQKPSIFMKVGEAFSDVQETEERVQNQIQSLHRLLVTENEKTLDTLKKNPRWHHVF